MSPPHPDARPGLRLSIAASFPAEALLPVLEFWFERLGIPADIELSPPGQVVQHLLDPSRRTPGQLDVAIVDPAGVPDPAALVSALGMASFAIVAPGPGAEALAERLAQARCPVLGPQAIAALAGSDAPAALYSREQYAALATVAVRHISASVRPPTKVIVVDADDTLWRGICAEDGPDGVHVDAGCRVLQRRLLVAHDAGVLLCVLSHNLPADVQAVLDGHPEMILRPAHFAAIRADWSDKAEGLDALAAELNLGLDTFVVIDDDPVQCASLRAARPEAFTIRLPHEDRERFIEHLWVLDPPQPGTGDRERPRRYRHERERRRELQAAPSLAQFLDELAVEVTIRPGAAGDVDRVAQLARRVTQFTTGALPPPLATDPDQLARIRCVEVRDRHGDYGLVGAFGIASGGAGELVLTPLLLSCRALGRGVEHRMLAAAGLQARAAGARTVVVPCVATRRNEIARRFLAALGGTCEELPGGPVYRIDASSLAELRFSPSAATPPAPPGREAAIAAQPAEWQEAEATARELASAAAIVAAVTARRRGRRASPDERVPPRTDGERAIASIWEEYLGIDGIGRDEDFFELGGSSMLAVQVLGRIAERTGVELALGTVLEATTVSALAEVMARATGPARDGPLVAIRAGGSEPPLFCLHGIDGLIVPYAALARHLRADRPILALEAAGLRPGEQPLDRVDELGEAYAAAIRRARPAGPYLLAGWSFGSMLAFDVAARLRATGADVPLVAMLDGFAPIAERDRHLPEPGGAPFLRLLVGLLEFAGEDGAGLLARLRALPRQAQWPAVLAQLDAQDPGLLLTLLLGWGAVEAPALGSTYAELRRLGDVERHALVLARGRSAHALGPGDDVASVRRRVALLRANLRALLTYAPAHREERIVYLRARELPADDLHEFLSDPTGGWSAYARAPVVAETVPGDHWTMFAPANAPALAGALDRAIAQAVR